MPEKSPAEASSTSWAQLDRAQKLRPEARSASWDELDLSQREAFKKIVLMLGEAVDPLLLRTESWRSERASPYSSRTSRTAFLSGERGTGKTTVLDSIIGHTNDSSAGKIADMDDEFQEALRKVRDNVIWLPKLDMEPIQQDINLLIAVMARIEESLSPGRASEGLEEAEAESWFEPVAEPLIAFQQLQTNIVLGWSSNVEQRKGQLDPDSFAMELMRNERARLALARDLDRVLDKIADALPRERKKGSPLFVLPLDDLDLNPRSCLQLLRLMRLISTPRLFLLIIGDEQLAELVVNLQMSSDLSRLVSDVRDSTQLSVYPEEVGRWAGTIAASALRKLLPPAQRVYLQRISFHGAMNFRPLGSGPSDPWLHQLLALCPLVPRSETPNYPVWASPQSATPTGAEGSQVWPQPRLSLRDLFLARVPLSPDATPKLLPINGTLTHDAVANSHYSAKSFFLVPLRTLTDFWFGLRNIAKADASLTADTDSLSNRAKELMTLIGTKCRRSLQGAHALPPIQRRQVPDSIAQDENQDWKLRPLPLRVYSNCATVRVIPDVRVLCADPPLPPAPARSPGRQISKQAATAAENVDQQEEAEPLEYSLRLAVQTGHGWRFEALPPSDPPGSGTASVPQTFGKGSSAPALEPETAAELIVFHDLLAFRQQADSVLLATIRSSPEWALAEWYCGELAKVALPWPAPPCQSFLEFDLFLASWNAHLQRRSSTDKLLDVADLAFAWIAAGTSIVNNQKPVALGQPTGKKLGSDAHWDLLIDALTEPLAKHSEISPRTQDWLISLALLAMPESGLPRDLQKTLTRNPFLGKCFDRYSFVIQRRRAARLATFVSNNMAELAAKLYAETPKAGFSKQHSLAKKTVYEIAQREMEPKSGSWPNPWPKAESKRVPGRENRSRAVSKPVPPANPKS